MNTHYGNECFFIEVKIVIASKAPEVDIEGQPQVLDDANTAVST